MKGFISNNRFGADWFILSNITCEFDYSDMYRMSGA